MAEVLVKVENVSKKFCRNLKKSLWYGVKDVLGEVTGRTKPSEELRPEEFWSLSDVSFELKRGECLGLIGPNGAGKSTLLKMLTGLIKPDTGRIAMRGRVGALIELGAGFNPILTGRENIYVNGAVLGFTREEIDRKYDAIVEFAEMKEFIEAPVQNYSSGMKVRLGFAIAAQMEPDVLIIDEVLAVGDVGFRAKCFNAIYEIMKKSAVIFVTHAMPQVSRICTDLIVLDHGKARYQGKDVSCGIDTYYTYFQEEKKSLVIARGSTSVENVQICSGEKGNVREIKFGEKLSLHFDLEIPEEINNPSISVTIANQELYEILQCSSYFNNFNIVNKGQGISVRVDLGKMYLNPAIYSICLTIMSAKHGDVLFKCQNICKFTVKGEFVGYSPVQVIGQWDVKPLKN